METKIKIFCSILAIAIFSGVSQKALADDSMWRNSCKSNGARAHRYVLDAGIKFFPNAAQLQSRLNQLNTNDFCDCVFNNFNKTFGETQVSKMMQYGYTPASDQAISEKEQKDKIYFACFGEQIGQPNLLPPKPTVDSIKDLFSSSATSSRSQGVKKQLSSIKTAIQTYFATNQKWPKDLNELLNTNLKFLKASDLKDPWGHPISYQNTNGQVELRSAGPDGKLGTADDIVKK